MTEPLRLRAGRSVGRTLYQVNPDGTEQLVGMVDTPELAAKTASTSRSEADPAGCTAGLRLS